MASIDSRLRRLEERSPAKLGSCPECGLSPGARGYIVLIDEEHPERSFQGDPNERFASCDQALYTVIQVVYDSPAAYEGGGSLLD